ncbi:hypothetical protein [Serratia proteamaculans]|uniref:hypothetical protein n=1 Tax=Serratia proteamaculans TaxID=28151 RepID=UPI0021BD5D34|nr:hypothetical protein [Serratia proteamaculans]
MSGFSGTLGPWLIDRYGKVVDCRGMTVGVSGVALPMTRDTECVANAHLVSAAPELLEALQETVKDLVAYQVNARNAAKINNRWEGVAEAVQPSIDKARAAINKALGR